MVNKSGECALCLQTVELRKSHVVSESLYADLYENPHRFSTIVIDKDAKDRYEQLGIRETLLCDNCEQLLNDRCENYGARAFRRVKSAAKSHREEFTFDGLDYRRFKLFQLAQFWRMAIAEHPLWQRVVLPSAILEDLRQTLLHGDPAAADYYGVMMEAIIADNNDTFDAFVPPITARLGDYQFVLATFAGFSWYYCVHKTVSDERLSKFFITTAGSVSVAIRELKDAWHVQRFADELESIGKL